jgi:hypothetical protein
VDQILGQILRQAVWERLDMLEELVSSADNRSLLSVARSELPRLTHGWRALLAAHAPDLRGRCPECSSRWRPRAALCSVWRAAHEHFISAEAVVSGTVSSGTVSSGTVSSGTVSSGTVSSGLSDEGRRTVLRTRHPTSLFPVGASAAG